MTRARAALVQLAGAALAIGCGAAPPASTQPHREATDVRTEVEAAEDAERARQHDQARAHYERAVALAHDAASEAFARREFAETLETWREVDDAIAQLERVVALAADDAASWHDLGVLYFQKRDPRARAALATAKRLAPRDLRPRIALAALYWSAGQRDLATAEYQALLELDLPDRIREKVTWALDQLRRAAPAPAP